MFNTTNRTNVGGDPSAARRTSVKRKGFRALLLGAMAATCLVMTAPSTSQADHRDGYWDNYWRWYDHSYRPYYQRRHHRRYENEYYRPDHRRYRNYRSEDRYGYGPFYYYEGRGRGGVNIGPLRFNWR